MSPNLTRDQAEQRSALLRVESYDIAIDLTDGNGSASEKTFSSTTVVRFTATQPGQGTWIDLVANEVHSATLNGVELDVAGYSEDTGIALPNLAEHNELAIHATCRYMNTGEGLHRFVDPADDQVYLYTQFETADAKRVFACFDQPDLKATYRLKVTAPDTWRVISNAPAESTRDTEQGAKETTFAKSDPLSTYLVALVAGPYVRWEDSYRDEHGTIPLGVYCRASLADAMDAERVFTETKQGFEFFHERFGIPYPFGKYDQLFVPEFNAGAMENAGAVTVRDEEVFSSKVTRYKYERRADILLHELAHMWFGDLVTMRWWDDLWLNESFAAWASAFAQAEATEYTHAWTTFASVEKSWAYMQDQLSSTHPIAADIVDLRAVEANFDGITYAKGASVLKQLVAYVGQNDFLSGLRTYFTRHAWKNATFADLILALEESSGRDLSDWSTKWLRTTGINTLSPKFELDDNGNFRSFEVIQGGAEPGAGELRPHHIAVGIYDDDAQGGLVRVNQVQVDVHGERTSVPELIGASAGKLVLVNDDDLTYCAMRLDPTSLSTLVQRIGDIRESLPRTLCWSAAWEMTRNAELKARDFVALVLRGIQAETEISVVQRVLLQAQSALKHFAEPEWAAQHGWPSFSDRILELAQDAEPGSDHQLAFVQALLPTDTGIAFGTILDDDKLKLVAAWLAGSASLPGLAVDAALRWKLLNALIAHGHATEQDIEAELARDDTATGRRHAAYARALLPDPEAKARAWQQAVYDDEISNSIILSSTLGFFHPAQVDLARPYVDEYFVAVEDVARRRSLEAAKPTVMYLFPSLIVEQSTLDATNAWLAKDQAPELRRWVIENKDRLERALQARAFDARPT